MGGAFWGPPKVAAERRRHLQTAQTLRVNQQLKEETATKTIKHVPIKFPCLSFVFSESL